MGISMYIECVYMYFYPCPVPLSNARVIIEDVLLIETIIPQSN